MTAVGTQFGAVLGALAVAAGGLVGISSAGGGSAGGAGSAGAGADSAARTALVVDATAARDGRDLVDDRLERVAAELRLPRTAAEARTDLRYFAEQGRRIVVMGPAARTAAQATGVPAEAAESLTSALAAVR